MLKLGMSQGWPGMLSATKSASLGMPQGKGTKGGIAAQLDDKGDKKKAELLLKGECANADAGLLVHVGEMCTSRQRSRKPTA